MHLEELETRINKLEVEVQTARDIEAIKKLKNAYSYYLEHWQEEELVDLFSHSDEVSVEINDTGLFKG